MSKISEALEKAKRDGQLDAFVETIDERRTVATNPLKRVAPEVAVSRSPESSVVRPSFEVPPATETACAGIVPDRLGDADPRLEPLHNPMSMVSEQYRSVRNRIEREISGRDGQVLAVTSSTKGEGKSLTSTNLALVLAQDASKRVLLVDADLRRPTIHALLGLSRSPGLSDVLHLGGAAPVLQTEFFGLSVVTAGEAQGQPSELLAGERFREFLREQCRYFDRIIIDTPPLNPISDVSFLAEAVDRVILVVRAEKTDKNLVASSVASLPAGKFLGVLLNRADGAQGGYGYGKGSYSQGYY